MAMSGAAVISARCLARLLGTSVTVTGWPTRRLSGFSGSASTMNTSLLRSSRL